MRMGAGEQFRRRYLSVATLPANLQKRGYTNAHPLACARALSHTSPGPISASIPFPPLGDARRRSRSSQWIPRRLSSLSCCESSSLLVRCRGFLLLAGPGARSGCLIGRCFFFSRRILPPSRPPSRLCFTRPCIDTPSSSSRVVARPKNPRPWRGRCSATADAGEEGQIRVPCPHLFFPDCQLSPAAGRPGLPGAGHVSRRVGCRQLSPEATNIVAPAAGYRNYCLWATIPAPAMPPVAGGGSSCCRTRLRVPCPAVSCCSFAPALRCWTRSGEPTWSADACVHTVSPRGGRVRRLQ